MGGGYLYEPRIELGRGLIPHHHRLHFLLHPVVFLPTLSLFHITLNLYLYISSLLKLYRHLVVHALYIFQKEVL